MYCGKKQTYIQNMGLCEVLTSNFQGDILSHSESKMCGLHEQSFTIVIIVGETTQRHTGAQRHTGDHVCVGVCCRCACNICPFTTWALEKYKWTLSKCSHIAIMATNISRYHYHDMIAGCMLAQRQKYDFWFVFKLKIMQGFNIIPC